MVIVAERLTKRYGARRGLDALDLRIEAGEVFGYLGPNGAGKSTTIRLMLDLIRPTSGSVRLLGQDPRIGGRELRRQIGYLPGTFVVSGRQRVDHLLTYFAYLRGGVPRSRIEELAERLNLDLGTTVRTLSKGNKQKVGIVQAFMHRPRLLLLDEPTSGLDPLLQRQFLELVGEAKGEGATVLISSHVLSEVQHCADRVGVIREGRLVAVEGVEQLRRMAVRRVRATFAQAPDAERYRHVRGVTKARVEGMTLHCDLAGEAAPLLGELARDGVRDLLCEEPDLESLFFRYYEARGDDDAA